MRQRTLLTVLLCCAIATIMVAAPTLNTSGAPDIKSVNALTFGPDGILFIGDSENARIFAIETGDTEMRSEVEDVDIKQIDKKIAEALGTSVDNITIQDMAINPLSKKVYLGVHFVDGTPLIITFDGGTMDKIDLSNLSYTTSELTYAVSEEAKDRRGRPLRGWSISDLNYFDGKVLVSGLSNKEFSSALYSIAYPFEDDQDVATLEIWHAAHGQFETHSPIKTFTATYLNGEPQIVASYTCTPLVVFPMNMLKDSEHVVGRTIAELGNRNTPLDIISMERDGKSYLLMANTSRALMKISYDAIEAYSSRLTEKVEENSGTAGVEFISLPLVNVLQLDKLDDQRFVMLQRKSNGDLDLYTGTANRWL